MCNEISSNRGGSYIDSPEWIKNKKTTIHPKNSNDKCFQYAIITALNHENIGKHRERITKIKPSNNQYEWKEIIFPAETKDWINFKTSNETNVLNCSHQIIGKKWYKQIFQNIIQGVKIKEFL